MHDSRETDPASSAGHGPRVVVETFNMSEPGDGVVPDFSHVMSALLSSIRTSNFGSGSESVYFRESASRTSGFSGLRDFRGGSNPPSGATAAPLESHHPPVILDSLTTLSQYLSHMRRQFSASLRVDNNTRQAADMHRNHVQESNAVLPEANVLGGLPTPASLAEVMLSTRQVLTEQAAECLSHLARQVENHTSLTDSSARATLQSNAMRSGALLQNLGALLLELGRTTMTLRMGQSPNDAVVNAGPAVFISSSAPNPIMVQPVPFYPGTNFGAFPLGALQPGSGLSGGTLGSAFLPRNVDIRISTGTFNQREPTGAQQVPGQTGTAVSDGGNPVNQSVADETGNPSSARESSVRVIPVRTVIAALPAQIRRSPSDTPPSSVGLVYPVMTRVQHVTSGNLNSARGSQAANERNHSGLQTEWQPNSESAGQQQNSNSNPGNGVHAMPPEISRLDQLLRAIFPPGGELNFQGPTTNPATQMPVGMTEAAAAVNRQEPASGVSDQGTFLSNMLRQMMPLISQNTATGSNNRQPSSSQENTDVGTSSHRQTEPPTPPDSKRQKRE